MLHCCKLQVVLKSKTGIVYKFQCGCCNDFFDDIFVWHLNVRIDHHTGISLLTKKQVKSKVSSVGNYLLFCNHDDLVFWHMRRKSFYWNWNRPD